MIPTILVVAVIGGFFKGGWWLALVAAVVWPVGLMAGDVIDADFEVLGAAAVGALNASFGIIVGQMIRGIFGR